MKITSRKKEILFLAVILLLQSVIFIWAGSSKKYIHMDEAYSLGLSTYHQVEIEDNEDFFNTWHDGSYYMDYLVLDEDEATDYSAVYNNQRDDVHPPLYYLLLRLALNFSVGEYSVWPGIAVNIIIYLFVTVLTYLVLLKLFRGHSYRKEKSMILTFMCSVSLSSVTAVVYMRMYALAALWVLLTAYLHILLTEKGPRPWLFVSIALVALAGSLTHYYYLFFLAMTYLVVVVGYLRRKLWKSAAAYTAAMLAAAGVSLAVFPYSIEHMFFGYRGEGAMHNMRDGASYLINFGQYLVLAGNSMNHILFPLAAVILISACILLYRRFYLGDKTVMGDGATSDSKAAVLRVVWLPTVFYFLLVAVASPWHALRYILPVCPLIFILVMYAAVWIVRRITDEGIADRVLAITLALMAAVPLLFGAVPQELFTEKAEIVSKLEDEYNLPTVYFLNTESNRFLDDILLFAELDESYVAEDVITYVDEIDEQTVRDIFDGKDTSQGVVVFINEQQYHPAVLRSVMEALGLESWIHLEHLNACDVYHVY